MDLHKLIETKYKDSTTKLGHAIKIDYRKSITTIWRLKWLDQGSENYVHIGIAQIEQDRNKYKIGWFHNDEQNPYKFDHYSNIDEVIDAIDERINLY